MCAMRAEPDVLDELAELVESMPSAGSPTQRHATSWAFWSRLVDGSGNICYRLMLNSLGAALPMAVMSDGPLFRGRPC